MKANIVKSLWKEDKIVTNAWITIPCSWTAELVADAGYDVMTIDAQHGLAVDIDTILPIFQAMRSSETAPFVRVPWNDPAYIMRMLDAGAEGIICPMINTREDTEAFVQACRFPPQGYRSFGPLRARAIHDNYFEEANDRIVTMAMIETPDAYKNLQDIAQTETLDGLFLGPWDLSISLGHKKVADFDSDEMKAVFDNILNTAAKNGLKAGVHVGNPEDAAMLGEMGFRFVTVFNDSKAIIDGAEESLKRFGR